MLISPLRLHHDLTSILSPTIDAGPHTALLILPEGRLLSSATRYDELYAEEAEGEAEEADNAPDMNGLSVSGGISGGAADGGEEGEGEEEEPYLDEPERIRLLCGLASQWEEDESPRVECELGRLLLVPIPLPSAGAPSTMPQNLPAAKGLQPRMFVLVLNGTKGTAWSDMTSKAEEFKRVWENGCGA
ncbi:uncharacterized protein MKK02DRAFT_38375 [Dioszegia hungarica]|uniref:Uncharacterized protein n=1 Tax=Dioszegia hungarica TaxID=4972 RepID=A0AA38LSV6_9TREE|nr:uncharacterized protein MKK02DRAFT_38375 [Dioszegia hungarica]KAI9633718.1 hypothetical protein MKK02DRAFT_38375 [Dioszegia hungarica]